MACAAAGYILAFQAPWLPERLVAARDFPALRRALGRQSTRPGAFTAQDIDRYVAAAARLGAMGAATNYRAAFRANPLAQVHSLRRVDAPTLVVWGDQDRSLGRGAGRAGPRLGPEGAGRADRRGQPLGARPTPPNGSTSSCWTSFSSLWAASYFLRINRRW
jgi:pimeloyl-ACP methyl ester carboxylesterase